VPCGCSTNALVSNQWLGSPVMRLLKVRADATVKVLDFGLAKLLDAENSRQVGYTPGVTNSPTITTPAMTHAGLILGTAAYMSPEQAKGKPIDKRSDIWAFGCVLYEMLAGARAFGGEDITDTIAAVVTRDPDWTRLPPLTPDSIRRLLRRCLTKSVQQRLRSIGDAALEIDDATQPVRDVSNAGAVVQPLKSPGSALGTPFGGRRDSRSGRSSGLDRRSPSSRGTLHVNRCGSFVSRPSGGGRHYGLWQ